MWWAVLVKFFDFMQILACFFSIFCEWAQKYDFVGLNFCERLQNLLNREKIPTHECSYPQKYLPIKSSKARCRVYFVGVQTKISVVHPNLKMLFHTVAVWNLSNWRSSAWLMVSRIIPPPIYSDYLIAKKEVGQKWLNFSFWLNFQPTKIYTE